MTTWFVTRHQGAVEWARRKGIVQGDSPGAEERLVDSIEARDVARGDQVIGTLPVHLVAEICARGGRYFHITMNVPVEWRGRELTPEDMDTFGAQCQEFIVLGNVPYATPAAPAETGRGIHICLVSDQHWANMLPILKRRPARVELVCTPEMLKPNRGLDRIARALERYGYGGETVTPHSAPAESATDFHVARSYARNLRDALAQRYPGAPLTLNATGGTKILSSAFFLEFHGFEILYTDTEAGGYLRHMEDADLPAEPLGSVVGSMDDYLHGQGYRILESASDDRTWRERAVQRRALTESLVIGFSGYHTEAHGGLVGELNRQAERVVKDILDKHPEGKRREQRQATLDRFVPQTDMKKPSCSKSVRTVFDGLVAAGLLARRDGSEAWHFLTHDALRYLNGGWLEEWAWLVAKDCNPDKCRAGVFIQAGEKAPGERADNELDLVVLHRNRLLIAECKTIHWQGANGKQDVLNKLDAMGSHARGLFGKSFLISARPLDEDARRRTKAYGIAVLEGGELSRFKLELEKWMSGTR